MTQAEYIKKGNELLNRILMAPLDFVNLENSDQKRKLVELLIFVGSIIPAFSPYLLDSTTISKKLFFGLLLFFLFFAILYYIIIQKEKSFSKQKDIKYYLFIIFIFVISFLVSMSFSAVLITLLLLGMADKSDVAMETVISSHTFFTFMILAALMKKERLTAFLFYIVLFAFYYGSSYYLKSLHH